MYLGKFALVMAVLLAGTPAAAEVIEVRDDGFIIRAVATVSASQREVWLKLTKPADWWSGEHTWSGDAANMTLTPQAGGCFCETIPGEDDDSGFKLNGSVAHATVLLANPLKLLRMEGGIGPLQSEPARGILTYALKPIDGGTMIQMEYAYGGSMRYKPAEMAPTVDKVLTQQLAQLQAALGALTDGAAAEAAPTDDDAEEPSLEAQIDALGTQE
ncbi:SRPBCC family protein [Qipengyuania marisflavi]|uniref:SRPBCC family protein n=1 Tax=Qipengyuania marisflavi TaxID=2486356 RepID=A0A5S3P9P3_9SPHN|nr:SRPBCC family protein [Qipengyuania marisflavi]TMM50224.1 SRPBCC family protein [Qipengyuania marisflavi]